MALWKVEKTGARRKSEDVYKVYTKVRLVSIDGTPFEWGDSSNEYTPTEINALIQTDEQRITNAEAMIASWAEVADAIAQLGP